MGFLIRLVIGLVMILGALFAAGLYLPDRVHVERRTTIAASPSEVFPLVSNFRRWNEWSPWAEIDPDMTETISGNGVGHRMEWTSAHPNVGNGSQEIIELEAPSRIVTRLSFDGQGTALATFTLAPVDGGTEVLWELDSNMRDEVPFLMQPIATYMGFFMDQMVGGDYERGLAKLKSVIEGRAGA